MGSSSSSSRNALASSSKEENEPRRTEGVCMFHSRCFGYFSDIPSNSLNSVAPERNCGRSAVPNTTDQVRGEAGPNKHINSENVKTPEIRDFSASISSMDYNERSRCRICPPISDASSSSTQDRIIPAWEPSSSFEIGNSNADKITERFDNNCCFNCSNSNTDHSDVQLRRATSLSSLEAYSIFQGRLGVQCFNVDRNQAFDVQHLRNGSATQQVHDNRLPAAHDSILGHRRMNSMQTRLRQYAALPVDALEWRRPFSEFSNIAQIENMHPLQAMVGNSGQNASTMRRSSSMTMESSEARRIQRRFGTPENLEENASFRRTRSIGRLRDRVVRRTTSSDVLFGMLQGDSMERESRRHNGRRPWDTLTRASSHQQGGTPTARQDQFLRTLRFISGNERQRDELYQRNEYSHTTNDNLLENRSLYLQERRRQARSQVRALQRLSNCSENLTGHERSCILAGHHYTGRCLCQIIGRTDESNTRANIARIIMLAEALFEVLDEMQSQSMPLSSRPSAVSLGSFPAPDYVVESIPVRIYTKREIIGIEEAAQCYICLVEYEEGDRMRVLPCHHDFHLLCIDKWLKEVHRVCPLCRANVCDASLTNRIRAF